MFSGNDIIKANSALQCESFAVLKAIKEAQIRGKEDMIILSDSEILIRSLNKKSSPFQLINICKDIYD